jgi:hypothetical protein
MSENVFNEQDRLSETAGVTREGQMNCLMRPLMIALGFAAVALGVIGIFVPGLPTTVFLLIALWAFSKSSDRFHSWLYNHPRLGAPIRDWHEHGVIPLRAKVMAIAMMTISMIWISLGIAESWALPAIVGACLVPIAGFIVTRPSHPHA